MRIVAGEKRGLVLMSPEGDAVRPTHDRVREAVFGRLQFEMQGCTFLDLFAGSGAMGIEAVSRGAGKAVLVDSAVSSVRIIRENVRRAGFENRCEILSCDYAAALLRLEKGSCNIVYIDPPYENRNYYVYALEMLKGREILRENACVILESDAAFDCTFAGYVSEKTKRYGRAYITYLRPGNE